MSCTADELLRYMRLQQAILMQHGSAHPWLCRSCAWNGCGAGSDTLLSAQMQLFARIATTRKSDHQAKLGCVTDE